MIRFNEPDPAGPSGQGALINNLGQRKPNA
jgi:hypothetical protein